MKQIGVGVIGCGNVALEGHLPYYLGTPRSKLMAIADVDEGKLAEVGTKFNVNHRYLDYRNLLRRKDIEAVSICVPPHLHAPIGVEALEEGKSVLCEKPIALSLEEADQLIRAARKNGVKLMVGHNLRFLPNHRKAREMLINHKIGEAILARAQFVSMGPLGAYGSQFYFKPKLGGGISFDTGIHLADLLMWFFGDVEEVGAVMNTYLEESQVDDVLSSVLRFKSGVVGEMTALWTKLRSWEALQSDNGLTIIGTKGRISSDLLGPSFSYYREGSLLCKLRGSAKITPKPLDPTVPFLARPYSFKKEIEHFVRCVVEDREPLVSGEDGKKALKVVLAVLESYREKKLVQLT